MPRKIKTFNTNEFLDEFMQPDPRLQQLIRRDYGQFFIVYVQELILPPTLHPNILIMMKYLTTNIGRLRLLGFLEGASLLILVFVAVPAKYVWHDPSLVETIGPIHGALFLLFVFNALHVGVEQNWKFWETTWQVLLASFIPFGTFYIDYKVLRHLQATEG